MNIDEFEAVEAQVSAAREELLVLVKKNPHDALSKFKLSLVNGLLRRANALLAEDERPLADFSEFDADELPSNSDVVVVLAQYLAALENLRVKHIQYSRGEWSWVSDGTRGAGRTYPPRKLRT
jgi:hypothetical protein